MGSEYPLSNQEVASTNVIGCGPCTEFASLQAQAEEVEKMLLDLRAAQQSLIFDINLHYSPFVGEIPNKAVCIIFGFIITRNTKAQQLGGIPVADSKIFHVNGGRRLQEMTGDRMGNPRTLDFPVNARCFLKFIHPPSRTCARVAQLDWKPCLEHFTRLIKVLLKP